VKKKARTDQGLFRWGDTKADEGMPRLLQNGEAGLEPVSCGFTARSAIKLSPCTTNPAVTAPLWIRCRPACGISLPSRPFDFQRYAFPRDALHWPSHCPPSTAPPSHRVSPSVRLYAGVPPSLAIEGFPLNQVASLLPRSFGFVAPVRLLCLRFDRGTCPRGFAPHAAVGSPATPIRRVMCHNAG
jgi:hypothetical protein